MTRGLHEGSLPIGDQGFHNHASIDSRLADTWRSVRLPRPLKPETRELALALGYEL
jgi:hypothetical protein